MKRKITVKSLLVLTLIVALAVPVIAATALTPKQATVYTGSSVIVNGKALDYTNTNGTKAEAIAVDGVTYLPLRAMADTVGMDVEWDNETKTAKLTSKSLQKGTLLYEDDKVAISFENITSEELYSSKMRYYMNFIVTNKTDVELTFWSDAISLNGWSYNSIYGSDDIAKNSTGRIQFYTDEEELPFTVNAITGTITVYDSSNTVLSRSYDVGFDVTVQ